MVGIQLVNESSHDVDIAKWAHVLTSQAANAAAEWRIKPLTVSVSHHPSWYRATLVDTIPEAPGALAYHDVGPDGRPYMRIGVQTTLDAGESVSAALSHEVLELLVDTYCQLWAFDPDRRALIAYEACDPVQGFSYTLDGVEVSDYVLPPWFGSGSGQVDRLGAITMPWSIGRGGYLIVMRAGTVSQVTADTEGVEAARLRRLGRSRSFWRQVSGALVVGSQF